MKFLAVIAICTALHTGPVCVIEKEIFKSPDRCQTFFQFHHLRMLQKQRGKIFTFQPQCWRVPAKKPKGKAI